MTTKPIPAIVSKRNEFTPADEFVEGALPYLPQEFQHVNFRKWLLTYTERVIRGIAHNFGTAAERGIEQAANLLCDPEYYDTKRKRNAQWRQRLKEQSDKQEAERIERKYCPTAEQIAKDVKWCEDQIAHYEKSLTAHKDHLEYLRGITPKNIRMMPKATK